MATALVKTKDNRVAYEKATGMFMTFYTFGENGWELEKTTYDIFAIVGDTLSINQDDESTEEVPHEFSDENLEENTTLGKLNFSADCTDYQNNILQKVYGYEEVGGALVAPNTYKDRYARILITFDHENGQKDIILPFVKLSAKPVLEGMRSGTATGSITGVAMSRYTYFPKEDEGTPSFANASTKSVNTPLAFVSDSTKVYVASGKQYVAIDHTKDEEDEHYIVLEETSGSTGA